MFIRSLKQLNRTISSRQHYTKILTFGFTYVLYHATGVNQVKNLDYIPPIDIRQISKKELHASLIAPRYYQNTLFLFNTKYNDILLTRLQGIRQIKIVQVSKIDNDEDALTQQYDGVSINSKGDSRLFKLQHMHDIIKLQNFYDGVQEVNSVDQLYSFLQQSDSRVILSYIPEERKTLTFQKSQEFDFDSFKRGNTKNLEELEDQFNQLKYENIDTFALHMVVKREDIAQQLGLSSGDVGQIYVMKKSNQFQNESSTIIKGQEYNMTKVEPDYNLEDISHFQELEENHPNYYAQKLADYIYFNQHQSDQPVAKKLETKKLDLMKVQPRISLRCLPYVSHIVNEQQLQNIALVGKQMGVTNYLLCGLDAEKDNDKLFKKLIQLKRNLNTHQQQQIIIIATENQDLLSKYFQVQCEDVSNTIRLVKLSHKDPEQKIKFDQIKQINLGQQQTINTQIQLKDHMDDIRHLSSSALRYRFFGKATYNKLKYFLATTIPEMGIQNVKQSEERFLFQKHQEIQYLEQPQMNQYIETITSSDIEEKVLSKSHQRSLMYFYKPNCTSCLAMSQSYNQLADILKEISNQSEKIIQKQLSLNPYDNHILNRYRIQNPNKFANLKIYKYNILNENPNFPSPAASPLLYLFGIQYPLNIDLVKNRIGPSDLEKLIQHIIKVIDSS